MPSIALKYSDKGQSTKDKGPKGLNTVSFSPLGRLGPLGPLGPLEVIA